MTKFISLDVETANADYSSICQIGIVVFENGIEIENWSSLIDPNSYFDPFNVSIHGIQETDVAGQPTFSEVFSELTNKMHSEIILHHGHFDRSSFHRCYDAFGLEPISCDWLDNTKIVRRAWERYSSRGYGLANLAKEFGIEFNHHDALEDARAAGQIALAAVEETGNGLREWLNLVRNPISGLTYSQSVQRNGLPDSPFFGEAITFTGSLKVPKAAAADVAQKLGFDVQPNVTKKLPIYALEFKTLVNS